MKKIVLVIVSVLLVTALYLGWTFFGPATYFDAKTKYLYIPSNGATKEKVLELLAKDSVLRSTTGFRWLGDRMKYWNKIIPGKYKVESGNSVFNIMRLLRNGRQSPVNLVITKFRTKEDFASLVGRKFECDSNAVLGFLNNNDSLKNYQLDTNTVITAVFPDTYTFFWNTTPGKIFNKLMRKYNAFWTSERIELARTKGLTPQSAYVLASIIEEETNKNDEKGNIASVYLNRMKKGMRLGADPTVKFALRDFGLKRIYNKHLNFVSPYNTYLVTGLPPGPICTSSTATIDSVLHSPETDYLYFVARSDFSGYHTFAATYDQHLKYAREYQDALNKYMQEAKPVKAGAANTH